MRKKSTVVKLTGLALLVFLLCVGVGFIAGYFGGVRGTEKGLESGYVVASIFGGSFLFVAVLAFLVLAFLRVWKDDFHD